MNFKSYQNIMDTASQIEESMLDLDERISAAYAGSEGAEEQAERIRQARQLLGAIQKDVVNKLDE